MALSWTIWLLFLIHTVPILCHNSATVAILRVKFLLRLNRVPNSVASLYTSRWVCEPKLHSHFKDYIDHVGKCEKFLFLCEMLFLFLIASPVRLTQLLTHA